MKTGAYIGRDLSGGVTSPSAVACEAIRVLIGSYSMCAGRMPRPVVCNEQLEKVPGHKNHSVRCSWNPRNIQKTTHTNTQRIRCLNCCRRCMPYTSAPRVFSGQSFPYCLLTADNGVLSSKRKVRQAVHNHYPIFPPPTRIWHAKKLLPDEYYIWYFFFYYFFHGKQNL